METKEVTRAEVEAQVQRARDQVRRSLDEMGRVIIGQSKMIEGMFMGLLAGGHVLLEGVPGLAKTLAIRSMAEVIDASFKRIQFTPDLLPADLTGTMIYRPQTGEFIPRKGPVFSNIILADEINRAPAKVQSALLEAMEEHQVTIGDNTYPLAEPFFVLATQNPIEQEGTYPLPEAQLDRFILKLGVRYPTQEEELEILRRVGDPQEVTLNRQLLKADIRRLRETAAMVTVDERIEQYIVAIVAASRESRQTINAYSRYIEYGASPRATLALFRCSKVKALLEGRAYVVPEDVKYVAPAVLRHRINLSYEAESDELTSDDVIQALLSAVPVP
ncbi:AAA family ATPase [Spirochaeta lutea]|uniref:ATPase n=1 Tax=Spirochaeta lutea TaxID=1480694 RepID=A0A098R0Z2_9SPIO|nr:MoxR family ATPase [Spirochaeta lutea]KGE73436.1 ATPase [Spirochaeta lutea]